MGYSTWSNESYTAYASNTSLRSLSREQVFTSRSIPEALDPKKITLRESCDSAENPNSTPIILALDQTGSMGFTIEEMVKNGLPDLMVKIHDTKTITDPHIMFMGVGDIHSPGDRAYLQVSQFETDLRIVEQLRSLWLEGNGGGNSYESYNLPWYFAAYRTKIDSIKRNQKGFLFTFGDEGVPDDLTERDINTVFGGSNNIVPTSNGQLLKDAEELYNVFHIIVEQGNFVRGRTEGRVHDAWTQLLGPNVLFMSDIKDTQDIATIAMRAVQGENLESMIAEHGQAKATRLRHAFKNALSV